MVSGRRLPIEARQIVYNVAKYLQDQKIKYKLKYNVGISTSEATGVSKSLVTTIIREFTPEDKKQNKRRRKIRDKDSLGQESGTKIAQKHDLEALGMKNDIWNSERDAEGLGVVNAVWLPEQKADQKSGVTVEPVKIKEEPGSDLSPYGGSFNDKINTENLDEPAFPVQFLGPTIVKKIKEEEEEEEEEYDDGEEYEGQEATSEQHIAKKKRNRGKVIARRTLLPPCGEKCRLKCASRLSEEQISSIRDRFWKLEDIALQREFIVDHSVRICPKFKLESGSTYRKRNLAYYFDVGGKKTRVCKHMFLSTLSVGRNYVATAWKKKTAEGRPTSKTL